MQHGRWYPTVTVLADGRPMVISGSQGTGPINATNPVIATIQVFDVTHPPGHRLSPERRQSPPASFGTPPSRCSPRSSTNHYDSPLLGG